MLLNKRLLVSMTLLAVAALACAVSGGGPTLEPGVRFRDDFSRAGAWDSASESGTGSVGTADGEYVILQYQTVFENKAEAVETVTPMVDWDGAWKVSGYFVK